MFFKRIYKKLDKLNKVELQTLKHTLSGKQLKVIVPMTGIGILSLVISLLCAKSGYVIAAFVCAGVSACFLINVALCILLFRSILQRINQNLTKDRI